MYTFRFIDHTADLGIELEADTLPEILLAGAAALDEATFGPIQRIHPQGEATIWTTSETDPEWILFAWLKHWLAVFHAEERVLVPLRIVPGVDSGADHTLAIDCAALVEGIAAANREIKAITLHEFRVVNEAGKWRARVIVDI